ncbi:MAG: hypothetical protein Q7U54_09485 [Bacteroidales bacterium]|nr:hypothetical protein [Bacteroidales bacterium]
MNSDEIRLDITEQISKTNESLSNYWGSPWFKGILEEDVDLLKKVHKKVTRYYTMQLVMSVLLSVFILIILLLNSLEILHKDLNNAGLLILFMITYLMGFYRYYKIKVNLEHKIYLLGLRERIDSE